MILDLAHEQLGWPSAAEVLMPPGGGAAVFAKLAQQKIERELVRLLGEAMVKVGVLSANPKSVTSEPPLALVCEFTQPVSDTIVEKTHRLCWNFSHCPILITLEPQRLRLWDCCEPPTIEDEDVPLFHGIREKSKAQVLDEPITDSELSERVTDLLHWINLATGQFIRDCQQAPERYFRREGRADYLLLKNLKALRERMTKPKAEGSRKRDGGALPVPICHDLLARVIFIEFLFQRKDSEGGTALNINKLHSLFRERRLNNRYATLAQILRNYEDTYNLFRWLNVQFNGDLFPSDEAAAPGVLSPLENEQRYVKPEHLYHLADFIEGKIDDQSGARFLWSQYSFDVIPLEFISSIYEEFVGREKTVHYTPLHLVDFVLDQTLPWGGTQWDLRILDPACGSGIFLVKAFQRLVHRLRSAKNEDPDPSDLRRLLEKNLFGIDKNPEAVRVAAFSLYLAMCDELDPRKYWTNVKFPPLCGVRLIASDFFAEDQRGFQTEQNAASFHLVVGNAPWGKATATEVADEWAEATGWLISNRDIGPLFLSKALYLLKKGGSLSMIQPTGALLLNGTGPARTFRARLFAEAQVHQVVNLSALRFNIFASAVWPSCVIVLTKTLPDDRSIVYISPKGGMTKDGSFRLRIEPLDIHGILPTEAVVDSLVWSALIWGQRRDLGVLRHMREASSLDECKKSGLYASREGIIRGKQGKVFRSFLVGKRLMPNESFPSNPLQLIEAAKLPLNDDYYTHHKDSVDFTAFAVPQLIIKQSWHQGSNRFQASLVESDLETGPVLCSDSYVSATTTGAPDTLLPVWAMLNSQLAVYFLLLTSGQFAAGIPKPLEKETRELPIPHITKRQLSKVRTLQQLDQVVTKAFGLNIAEQALVEDLFNITLRDFKGDENSPGRQITQRREGTGLSLTEEPDLCLYADYFLRVLRASFGEDKAIGVKIYQERHNGRLLPLRLMVICFDVHLDPPIQIVPMDYTTLRSEIMAHNDDQVRRDAHGGVYTKSVVRAYSLTKIRGKSVPIALLLKPDQKRYWTRSAAMHDADEVVADMHRSTLSP